MTEPARRRYRELPGARTEIHQAGGGSQAVGLELGQVRFWIGVPLLTVESGNKGLVEVFRSRVREFVKHPGIGHAITVLPAGQTPLLS
jgi:hypothetical protein